MYVYSMQDGFWEWDDEKAARSEREHGVSFLEAQSVFLDPNRIEFVDEDHSEDEGRFAVIGFSRNGRLLIVVFTPRGRDFASSPRAWRNRMNRSFMNNSNPQWKLSPKSKRVPKEHRRQLPPEAFEERNTKVRITSYIDLDVLEYFKQRAAEMSVPYQTLINRELRRTMDAGKALGGQSVTEKLLQARTLVDDAIRSSST